jgi:hypothetical protein
MERRSFEVSSTARIISDVICRCLTVNQWRSTKCLSRVRAYCWSCESAVQQVLQQTGRDRQEHGSRLGYNGVTVHREAAGRSGMPSDECSQDATLPGKMWSSGSLYQLTTEMKNGAR